MSSRRAIALLFLVPGCVHSTTAAKQLPDPPAAFAAGKPGAARGADPGQFWELFGDPALSRLVRDALRDNLTIAQAWARTRQARASLKLARSGWWPRISARGEAGRAHTAMKFGSAEQDFDRNTLTLGLALSYEVDLWGKVRYAAQAAQLEVAATEDDVRAAYLSVAAQIVEGYFLATELRAQLTLLAQTTRNRESHLELVRRRYDEGVVTALDLYQAQQNLAAARAQQHVFADQLASAEHALAVLAGRAPGKAVAGSLVELPRAVQALPAGLPAQLLLRRPDLRAAHRRLMAADAQIGQAVAGHYPSLTLSAAVGYQFDPTAFVWNILGGLVAPIFEGNRVSAEVESREALLQLALVSYKATLLQALREVEDALVSGAQVTERLRWLEQKAAAAEGALRMATDQYAQGLTTFLQVLSAEQGVYAARSELLSARRALVSARVQLAKALGGSWMDRELERRAREQQRKPKSDKKRGS